MFSSTKYEFQPRDSIQLILVTTARSRTTCSTTCNEQPACHTFDYDSASGRCRLFEADQTTGSIIASSSPNSIVGTILTAPSQFLNTHNQSCEACQENRYEFCSANGSTCQCRPHTFWNGSMCLLQLFENDSCSNIDACRSDLNLHCATEYGQFSICTSGFISLASTIITTVMATTHMSTFTAITTAATNKITAAITTTAINKITAAITTGATDITSATNKITTAITTGATDITSATNKITTAITTGATDITSATDKITTPITTGATDITSATSKITTAITATATNKITATITATATNKITTAITATATDKITTAITTAATDKITTAITTGATDITSATDKITTPITTGATDITSATDKITTPITTGATDITSATSKITTAITATATNKITATITATATNKITTAITATATNKITTAITTGATDITSATNKITTALTATATNKITAAITTTATNKITAALTATATNKITAAITATATHKITAAITTTATHKITTATITTIIQQNVTTVAGSYNGSCASLSGGLTTLHTQAGVAVSNNGTLYVADGSPINALLAFEPNNLTGKQIMTFDYWPAYILIDAVSSSIYVTVFHSNLVLIWPSNRTIPIDASSSGCYMTQLYQPTGIIMDSLGNLYVGCYACSWVTKWSPNATIATLVAGSPSGLAGNDSQHLYRPYGMSIDESNSLLYVVDRFNHRVQKFVLGNLTGVTVVGGNGPGAASNQLNTPTALFISQRDHSYYICDCGNNRIQKWAMNATYGVTIAGSSTGVAGSTLYLLNQPYDMWVHPNGTYVLISDSNNCRVQKYILY